MRHILYAGEDYPCRELLINGNRVAISVESLEKVLFPKEDGVYADKTAQQIDDKIAFYVADNDITLSDGRLMKLLPKEIVG